MSASYTIKHVIDRLALWAGSHSNYFLDILNGNIQLTVRKLAPNETTNTHVNHTMEVSLSCYFPCKHLTKDENKRKPKPWPHNNNKLRKYTPTKGQRLFPNCMECYLEVIRQPQWIPYSGKFSNGASFRIFRMLAPYSKIKFEQHGQLLEAQFKVLTMSLYSYSAEASKQSVLPNGSLSASVSSTTIKEANEAVTRERASGEGVTLSSNLSSSCNWQVCLSTRQPSGYSALL